MRAIVKAVTKMKNRKICKFLKLINLLLSSRDMSEPKKSAKSEMPMPEGLFPVGDTKHVAMKGTFSDYKTMHP